MKAAKTLPVFWQLEKMNIGDLVFRFHHLSSTMDFARRLAELNYPEGAAVIAEEQTAGRGTKGRSWYSARGKGLYVSFLLRPSPGSLNLLPLTIGLAAAEAVHQLSGIEIRLKWPNDLVFEGKKVGGILCEAGTTGEKSAYTIAGIGINLHHKVVDFPPEISSLATSLFIISGKTLEKESLFDLLSKSLQFWYNKLEKGEASSIIDQYQQKLSFTPGQRLILRNEEGEIEGQFQGIDLSGGLRLKVDQEIKIFHASEIIKVLS